MVHNKRILYTRHDGGVSVCMPAPDCLAWLACGGYWDGRGINLDDQVARAVAAGHFEWAAARFVRAMDRGGCTAAEAFEIIRDRDCAHLGTACELIDARELPERTFRDAWRRSHNGGPIGIDLAAARRIQFGRITGAANRERARRAGDIEDAGCDLVLPLGQLRDRLRLAGSAEAIARVWPEELPAWR